MVLTYKIPYEEGLHSRPAIQLTELHKKFPNANLTICRTNDTSKKISCKSLISILVANLQKDEEIEINYDSIEEQNEIKKALDKLFLVENK